MIGLVGVWPGPFFGSLRMSRPPFRSPTWPSRPAPTRSPPRPGWQGWHLLRWMSYWLSLLALAGPWTLKGWKLGPAHTGQAREACAVVSIHEGDTMTLRCAGQKAKVRLYCMSVAPRWRRRRGAGRVGITRAAHAVERGVRVARPRPVRPGPGRGARRSQEPQPEPARSWGGGTLPALLQRAQVRHRRADRQNLAARREG